MTSTDTGEANQTTELGTLNTDSAAEALLARWTKEDAPKTGEPSEKEGEPKTEKAETSTEETTESTEETPEDDSEETTPEKKYADSDETYVKIKVGEEEHEVTVKELKRLFGQEASLTRKSQEVAELRKKADTDTAKALAGLQVMAQRAQQRAAPYKQIDFLVAAKELNADDLNTLRQEAQRALEEERFLSNELDGYVKQVQTTQQAQVVEQAKACIKSKTDETSVKNISGWNEKLYDEMRAFAVNQGIDKSVINAVVDPAVIKMLHMAMQYQKGISKSVTTKVNKTPKKIVKTTQTVQPKSSDDSTAKQKKAMDQLRRKGDTDSAAEAFLARWDKASND